MREEIERRFAPDQVEAVAGLLGEYGGGKFQREAERVQIDILKLCKGKIEKVADLVEHAKRDYRDVITWAEYSRMMKYPVAFMRKGPNWKAQPGAGVLTAHSRFMSRLREEGKLIVSGPFVDDAEPLWMYVFNLESIAEAETIMAGDPAVEAGQYRFEFRPWFAPFGIRVNFKEAMEAES